MGSDYSGNSPQSRVRQAERAYANGEINWNEARRRIRAEGYTPGTASETRENYRRRGRRR